jgi:hypothetical protein
VVGEAEVAEIGLQIRIPPGGENLDNHIDIVCRSSRGELGLFHQELNDSPADKGIVEAEFVEPIGDGSHSANVRLRHGGLSNA